MAGRKRGLGKNLDEIFAEQEAARAIREASGRPDGLDLLVPNITNVSRTDGLDILDISRPSQYGNDPDFGEGYEVINPARSNNPLGRPRAQKIGYNRKLKYLAILMRDDKMVGYPGVSIEDWEDYQNYNSTSDYIDTVLAGYSNGGWDDLGNNVPPQTREQLFEEGTKD